MRFLLAASFTQSLAKLDGRSQGLAKQSAFDFSVNPAQPGAKFHRLHKARDKNLWSFRVNDDIRIIVYKSGADLMFCYADHHDAAYAWAQNRVIEPHPHTGAMQVVEIRERVEERVKHVIKEVEEEPPIFSKYGRDYLLALGVPEQWLDALAYIGETGFLNLIDELPQEAAENLMQLAQGRPVPVPVVMKGADPFSHPDAQRRFRVLDEDQHLLRQALEAPWEQWIVFLHPSQQEVVDRSFSGPAWVSGGAGTGKTVVALHRAARLAQNSPQKKLLLTTYSRTLSARLRHNLNLLLDAEALHSTQITVSNLHSVAADLWTQHSGQTFSPLFQDRLNSFIAEAVAATNSGEFTNNFVLSEWENVIDAQGINSWDAYKNASRIGRGVPLGARQRLQLWKVFEYVQRALRGQGLMSFTKLCHATAELLDRSDIRPFRHVVADEIQDFGPAELRLLRTLCPSARDDLFLCGDMGQRIYKGKTSFLATGVDIRGRSSRLKLNYRTTEQIRRFSDNLLPGAIMDADGEAESRDSVSLLSGSVPETALFKSVNDEIQGVVDWLRPLLNGGYAPGDIAIFCRTNSVLKERAAQVAAACGAEIHQLTDDDPPTPTCISLGTMHRAKGLEFKVVMVMGCERRNLPLAYALGGMHDEMEREMFVEQEKQLLYVACTRARERLLLTAAGEFTTLLRSPKEASEEDKQ